MARLEEVRRREERVVPVQGVHQREVALVLVDARGEVGELGGDGGAERAVGEQAGRAGEGLDGHALEEGLEGGKVGGEGGDGVHSREEAAGC